MKRVFFASVLFLLMALASGVQAGESSTTLLLATVDNFPPFTYRAEGKLTGVDTDLIDEMARRIGVNVKIQVYPWARVISSLSKGEIDGGFAAFETEERKEFCLYVGVLHFEEFYIFVRKGNEFTYSSVADLYGKTIGKDRGVFVNAEFERAAKAGRIKLDEVNDMSMMNVKKLDAGRIDAAIGDLGVMRYYAKLLGVEKNIIPLKAIRKPTPAYLVLSKNSPLENKAKLQKKMQGALAEMRKDGTYKQIFDRHVAKGK